MISDPGGTVGGTATIEATATASGNLLIDYLELMPRSVGACVADPTPVTGDPAAFSPGFALPEPTEEVREFYSAATAGWRPLGEYAGHRLSLLDLTGNPGTHTTKTFPSLLIVARAVEYIRRTGEPVTIFSPTSANKGTALRDAVLRAIDANLVTPEQLRVVILAPWSCRDKLRASRLSADARLRELNPLLLYTGGEPEAVKRIGREFADRHAAQLKRRHGTNLWFSLELTNYLVADTARAYFEQDADPTDATGRPRLHAHAVSSAFGLLGYHRGRAVLEHGGQASVASRPASLLVQHMATSDMVLSLRRGSFERDNLPSYRRDPATGLYHQDAEEADPRFPATIHDPDEVLDPTFYTRRPVTSAAMNAIIGRFGGDGIVVSLHECLERYPAIRARLAGHGRGLPADFRTLREWSLVMAMTGVFNAIDRGLVEPGADIVVHGSGWYATPDYQTPDLSTTPTVESVADVAAAVLG
ncbi:MAG: hypothetical protein GEV28_14935 [Actinophytocola sp.]|uniref:DUF6002 family protein n=1 Tax=Actinophytocola sp. TaxID=1872138 RepID=UPI00132443C4|nr:DUF6002 family protein [Actinophytocola sp.]MPZ81618.1 hypothetical protein [Actinophytocola sp.]